MLASFKECKMRRFFLPTLIFGFVAAAAIVSPAISLKAAKKTAPPFNKEVLPILQKNCQECHRPGAIAPMSFMTYKDARPYARAIAKATTAKTMAPWFAV